MLLGNSTHTTLKKYRVALGVLSSIAYSHFFPVLQASDFIINLYKYGSFTKIEEIMAFNDKLRNSIQHRFSFIERHFVNLLIDCKK